MCKKLKTPLNGEVCQLGKGQKESRIILGMKQLPEG